MKFIQKEAALYPTRELAAQVAELAASAFQEVHGWTTEQIEASLLRDCYIFAMKDQKMLGYLCYQQLFDEAELLNIAVDPVWQGKGTGYKLIQQSCEQLLLANVNNFFLEVRKSNFKAKRLYSKAGFIELYTRKNYYSRPIEDALVMRLDLTKENFNIHDKT